MRRTDIWIFPGLDRKRFFGIVGMVLSAAVRAGIPDNRDIIGGRWDTYLALQNVHAQNYHIFTPAEARIVHVLGPHNGSRPAYANHAYNYKFRPGQSDIWFWNSGDPFDYAAWIQTRRRIPTDGTKSSACWR